jgi:hypothetical protein
VACFEIYDESVIPDAVLPEAKDRPAWMWGTEEPGRECHVVIEPPPKNGPPTRVWPDQADVYNQLRNASLRGGSTLEKHGGVASLFPAEPDIKKRKLVVKQEAYVTWNPLSVSEKLADAIPVTEHFAVGFSLPPLDPPRNTPVVRELEEMEKPVRTGNGKGKGKASRASAGDAKVNGTRTPTPKPGAKRRASKVDDDETETSEDDNDRVVTAAAAAPDVLGGRGDDEDEETPARQPQRKRQKKDAVAASGPAAAAAAAVGGPAPQVDGVSCIAEAATAVQFLSLELGQLAVRELDALRRGAHLRNAVGFAASIFFALGAARTAFRL